MTEKEQLESLKRFVKQLARYEELNDDQIQINLLNSEKDGIDYNRSSIALACRYHLDKIEGKV